MGFVLYFRFLFIYLFRLFYSSFVLAVCDSCIQNIATKAKEFNVHK